MGIPHIPLEAGGTYHLYNHAVGSDKLFRQDENYTFFKGKFFARVPPIAEILAYCLMPNHFHFALRFKEKDELMLLWKEKFTRLKASREKRHIYDNADHVLIDELIIMEFANLFNSYAQAFNKMYGRMGSLFKESFPRKIINDDLGLIRLICYIHNNPVNHGFTNKRENWKHSSYNSMISNSKTIMPREDVLKIFGGKENFIFLHDRFLGEEF